VAGNNNHFGGNRHSGYVTNIVGVTKVSEDASIKIPTYALPIVAAAISFLMGYAAMSANVSHASEARDRIEAVAEEAIKATQKNGQAIAVTDQKVQAVIDSLARQEKIQEKSAEQLQMMLETLLKSSN